MRQRQKAQSIMEYLLVFGGIVLAVIVGAQVMNRKTAASYNTSGGVIDNATSKLNNIVG